MKDIGKIKVLAVGPSDIKVLVLDVAKEYPEMNIHYAIYTNENEVVDTVKQHENNHDILLFAGSLPYNIVKENMNITKPMYYIKFQGTALYRVLYHLNRKSNNDFTEEMMNISMDNMRKFEVDECFEELEINVNKLFMYENSLEQNMDRLIDYHRQLWQNKKIDVAITCVGSVYEQLKKLDIPVARVRPTRVAVRNSLEQVLLEGENLQQHGSQIAVGIIDVSNMYKDDHLTEYQQQRRILSLQNILVDYGEASQSIIKWPDGKEVKFITTRGALQFENGESKELNLLKNIFSKTEVKAKLGIGIGRTANEAENHAREALMKASGNKSNCFVVDMDGTVSGPLGNQLQLTYSIRNDNEELLAMAKKANVSSATLNRIASFCEVQGKNTVTTVELAGGLGITQRSARRILNKLEQVDLAVVTGEEQPVNRGRPRQVYSLFPEKSSIKTE
ncbi:GTP cyclohydrolase IIa [Virgibacillus oceani]